MGEIPTFLRNEVEERKAKGIGKAKCHDEPLFDAEKSQTALKYLQYQEREKKINHFPSSQKRFHILNLKKKKIKRKVSYTKNAFQKYFFFKKQMYGQMSLKTLQISFYFKYIWTFSRFNLH